MRGKYVVVILDKRFKKRDESVGVGIFAPESVWMRAACVITIYLRKDHQIVLLYVFVVS